MDTLDNILKQPAAGLRVTYRKVPVVITGANAICKNLPYQLDGPITKVTGIAISADGLDSDARAYDLTLGVNINGIVVLPDDFEGSLLFNSPAVPTSKRFLDTQEPKGGGKIEVRIVDRNLGNSATYPYTLYLTLRCEATN